MKIRRDELPFWEMVYAAGIAGRLNNGTSRGTANDAVEDRRELEFIEDEAPVKSRRNVPVMDTKPASRGKK